MLPQTKKYLAKHQYVEALHSARELSIYRHIISSMSSSYVNVSNVESSDHASQINPLRAGFTCLHHACSIDDPESITMLLAKGARMDIIDKHGCSPLCTALKFNSPRSVKLLVAEGADVNNLGRHEGENEIESDCPFPLRIPPLACAASVDNVKFLIDAGAILCPSPPPELTQTNMPRYYDTFFAAHTYVAQDKTDLLVALLQEEGDAIGRAACDPSKRGDVIADQARTLTDKMTPLHKASVLKNDRIVSFLLTGGGGCESTNPTKTLNNSNAVPREPIRRFDKELVSYYRLIVNRPDETNNTPLHCVFQGGVLSGETPGLYATAKFLLFMGADPTIRNDHGETPLHWAAIAGCHRSLSLLLATSWDAISGTSKHRNEEIHDVVALMPYLHLGPKVPADIDARDNHGYTALHHATDFGKPETVKVLLETACNPNVSAIPPSHGDGRPTMKAPMYLGTPLHLAVQQLYTTISQMLVRGGADVNAVDGDDRTPLHYACRAGYSTPTPDIAMLLLKLKNININHQDKHGRTALDYALQHRDFQKVVTTLRSLGAKSTDKKVSSNKRSRSGDTHTKQSNQLGPKVERRRR